MSKTNAPEKDPKTMIQKELEEWFLGREWLSGLRLNPDSGINLRAFAEHYYAFPQRWQQTFAFLKRSDLKTLPLGRIDLDENCFALISEYTTKNPEDARFEAHREYIDLQYIIEGEEMMGYVPLTTTTPLVEYNSEKDILFVNSPESRLTKATPDNFFIFFPSDAHRPGVKSLQNSRVRKLVVKIAVR